MVAVALLLVILSYGHKLACSTLGAGIGNPADRYDTHVYRLACYSDTLTLFNLRDLGSHVFPYVHGWYTATRCLRFTAARSSTRRSPASGCG